MPWFVFTERIVCVWRSTIGISHCIQQMLFFQILIPTLYVGFEFAAYSPSEPKDLFLLAVAYIIGSSPRVEDNTLPTICQTLMWCP